MNYICLMCEWRGDVDEDTVTCPSCGSDNIEELEEDEDEL